MGQLGLSYSSKMEDYYKEGSDELLQISAVLDYLGIFDPSARAAVTHNLLHHNTPSYDVKDDNLDDYLNTAVADDKTTGVMLFLLLAIFFISLSASIFTLYNSKRLELYKAASKPVSGSRRWMKLDQAEIPPTKGERAEDWEVGNISDRNKHTASYGGDS